MQTLFIAGGSASGKSTLARMIADALAARGQGVTVLRQDSFYHDRPDGSDGTDRHLYDFDQPYAIDWDTFEAALRALQAGRAAAVPDYDFGVSRRVGMGALRPEGVLLIVDGTLILHAEGLRSHADACLYVRAPQALRRARRLHRDTVERNRDPADIDRQLRTQVFPAHDAHAAPSAAHADLVLDATDIMRAPDAAIAAVLACCPVAD